MEREDLEYVGFWPRVGASIIDTLLLGFICWPIATAIYGPSYWVSTGLIKGPADFMISWVFPAVAVLLFWVYRQATPGKMAISARIVDARTGQKPSTGQLIGRYFGYYVSVSHPNESLVVRSNFPMFAQPRRAAVTMAVWPNDRPCPAPPSGLKAGWRIRENSFPASTMEVV